MTNKNVFTEQDTEDYYDANDGAYRALWDSEGRVHWGYFDMDNQNDFCRAGHRMTELMIKKAGIDNSSKVLDVGCGNGTITIDVVKKCGCTAVGIDPSGVHIQNAHLALKKLPDHLKSKLSFDKGSAANLPYQDTSFSHVWSMGTIYHIHQKEKALQEIYRVLKPDGIFIFEDLFKPEKKISEQTKKLVYKGLLFDTNFSFASYQSFLKKIGFEVIEAENLSLQLKKNYEVLAGMIKTKFNLGQDEPLRSIYQKWLERYIASVAAVENSELGWGLFLCKKPST